MQLRQIRAWKGLSQKALAEKMGVSPTNIYNYEIGRTEPSIEVLKQLSNVLDVTIDELVGRTDDFGNVCVPGQTSDRTADALSEEERALIKCYRAMGMVEKRAIMTTASSFASLNSGAEEESAN